MHTIAQPSSATSSIVLATGLAVGPTLLVLAEVIAVSLVIAGVVTLIIGRGQAMLKTDDAKPKRSKFDSIFKLRAIAVAGCLILLFEVHGMVFKSGIGFWTTPVLATLFTIILATVFTFALLRKEEQLHRVLSLNEERYTLLFEKSLTGAYRTTLDGRILDCNVSFCQMFGYETREEVIGKSIETAYPAVEDRARFIDELMAAKQLTNLEQRLQKRDGTALWVLNSATLVAHKAGLEPEIKGTVTDISEIRKAEQEQRRLAAIVSCSDDAIISVTLEGAIETWNVGAERIFGFTAEEMIGKSIGILAPADRSDEYAKILARVKSGGAIASVETTRVKKNGLQINVSISLSPIKDASGEVIGAATIVLDITQRKQVEESLRRSEIEYRLMFQANPVPMFVFDRDTLKFLAVNQAAVRQYGFAQHDFLSMSIADLYPKEDHADLAEDLARRARGATALDFWRHRRKNGEIIDVEIVCHELDFHGIDAMLVAAHDITMRKQSEEALLMKTALLEAQSETTLDGILVVDKSDHIILANQ